MASKKIAVVLQKKFGRFATVLIYAVLEWVLILMLLIGALLSYLTTKFAEYFGLQPPCPWCSRIDHVLGNEDQAFYTKFVCDLHAREISSLGYCHVHKHLSDIQGMCEDCLHSFATEDRSNSCAERSLEGKFGVGPEYAGDGIQLGSEMEHDGDKNNQGIHLGFQMDNQRGENQQGIHVGNHLGINGHGFHMDHQSESTEQGIHPSFLMDESNTMKGQFTDGGLCSCCKAPLKIKFLLQPLVRAKLKDRHEKDKVDFVCVNTVVESVEDVDEEDAQSRSVAYPEPVLQECTDRHERALTETEVEDMSFNPLAHIGYSELKGTSESGSEDSVSDTGDLDEMIAEDGKGLGRQDLQEAETAVEVISENVMNGLVHDLISDVDNLCFDPSPAKFVLENEVETHKDIILEENFKKPAEGIEPWTTPEQLLGEDNVTVKDKSETRSGVKSLNPFVDDMSSFETPTLRSDGQGTFLVGHQVGKECTLRGAELLHEALEVAQSSEALEVAQSSENVLIALGENENKEISLEGLSLEAGGILAHGFRDHDWYGILEYGHSLPISANEVEKLPAEAGHSEFTFSTKDIIETNEANFGLSAQITSAEGVHPVEVVDYFGTEDLNEEPENIETNNRREESHRIDVDPFGEREEANKPQEEVKILQRGFSPKELDQTALGRPSIETLLGGPGVTDEYRTPGTPSFIEGLHMLHKRLSVERNDSGIESLDGSILSEIEGESAVDRLKRQLELERKSLNNLYTELEEERSASAVAANQAMAMITRIQEEKAQMQMEALQYQRMMEEQAEYDQEALQLLNEVLVKREKEIQDLEKELELYRKRFHYEATKSSKVKHRKTSSEKSKAHIKAEGNRNGEPPNEQYQKQKSSSISSSSEDSDESSSNTHEVEDIILQQSNQIYTPAESTMNVSGVYEEQKLDDSLDESMVDLEEERLSILEQLKSLEERLHTLADDGESEMRFHTLAYNGDSEVGEPQLDVSEHGMAHPQANAGLEEYHEFMVGENISRFPGSGEDSSIQEKANGNDEYLPIWDISDVHDNLKDIHLDKDHQKSGNTGNIDTSTASKAPSARNVGSVKARRLLPLFEATSFEDEPYYTEASYPTNQSNDWRSISMIARDNGRVVIEEEVQQLNERLQALEADREFIKHSIKSLRKGDEGMKLLHEIAQHLRELRRIDMRASSLNDSSTHQNAVFVSSSEGNGTINTHPHY